MRIGFEIAPFFGPRPCADRETLDQPRDAGHNLRSAGSKSELASVERELRAALAEKMILDFDYLPLPDLGVAPAPRSGSGGSGKVTDKKGAN